MSGREIYHLVCADTNLDAAVSRLSREDLAEAAQYLSDIGPTGGVPAQIFGMISARLSAPIKRRKEAAAKI